MKLKNEKYDFIDLFSGIGGFALGAQMAGVEIEKHYFSVIEAFPIEVYKKRFPGAVALGSITEVTDNEFREIKKQSENEFIIAGGFPCQDISLAGKGAGIEGTRSGLWFEMQRAIRIL